MGGAAAPPQFSIRRKMNLIHAPAIRPILQPRHQSGSHRILANILPLLRVTFAVAQPMMKSAGLKFPCIGRCFRQPVFPETHPAFEGEFQIVRRAEQMQMIRHQQIIAHEPCRRRAFPDVVQGALHGSLRQPAFTFIGANGEKNPVRSAERNANSFGRRVTARFAERRFAHANFLTYRRQMGKPNVDGELKWAERQLCPTKIKSR